MTLTAAILEHLSLSVVVLDNNLNLQYMNGAAENLTATSFHQAEGHSISSLFDISEAWQQDLRSVLENGSPFVRRQMDWGLAHSDRHVTVDCSVTEFDYEQQTCLLLEIQPVDRLLRISKEEALVSSEQTSRNLVRGLAHEIKNPLGGIRGAAQLLGKELNSEELKDYTQVIIEESDRLRNLVDRMLGSNKPLHLQILNIHEVLERVVSLVSIEASAELSFNRDYDPSIPDILIDKEQMIQVFLNIVRNAMQALQQEKTESPQVTLRSRIQRNFTIGKKQYRLLCRIDVIDNGPGIDEELIGDVFYPMISGRAEGTGLGLAISQSIVVQHKGLIECDSVSGNTIFSIFLPLDSE